VLAPQVILDIGIGTGVLSAPWDAKIIGVDIDPASIAYCDEFLHCTFESLRQWELDTPDLILSNPPFNGAPKRALYPEIILRKIVALFGKDIPIVMFTPSGMRLNQRKQSSRWQWMRNEGLEISSIITLPIDIYDSVLAQSEILCFNLPQLKAHYFLPA